MFWKMFILTALCIFGGGYYLGTYLFNHLEYFNLVLITLPIFAIVAALSQSSIISYVACLFISTAFNIVTVTTLQIDTFNFSAFTIATAIGTAIAYVLCLFYIRDICK